MKSILIYVELDREGKPLPVVFELANKAQRLAKKLGACEVNALLITSQFQACDEMKQTPFDKIFVVKDERLKDYNTEYFSRIALDVVSEIKPEIVLIGATTQGRDLAPRISMKLDTGLTADCTELDINEKGLLAATRPTFGGNLMATILCKNLPQMATVRPNVLKTEKETEFRKTEYIEKSPNIVGIEKKVQLIEFIKSQCVGTKIEEADIIVAGGKGLRVKENFALVEKLAQKLGGVAAASRSIVDLGWCDSSIQVGQTGKIVSPKLYIACGISGAIQHTVGMSGAEKIIAINKDDNAPIFKVADIGIIGDALEILPELINAL